MRLLIDETFATATYTVPIASGWAAAPDGVVVEARPGLVASSVRGHDVALLPSSELLLLQHTHDVLSGVAVVAAAVGAVAMRTPVRPDDVQRTPVRLLDVSGTAELLARATVAPFYGIAVNGWARDDAAAARAAVVIVEGAEALREPEGGFSEDLVRAWFILTAQPVVSHVALAPRDLPAERLADVFAFLDAARAEGLARRREWRPALADQERVPRERAGAFWGAQRLALEEADRQALFALLRRGSPETSISLPTNVQFINGIGM